MAVDPTQEFLKQLRLQHAFANAEWDLFVEEFYQQLFSRSEKLPARLIALEKDSHSILLDLNQVISQTTIQGWAKLQHILVRRIDLAAGFVPEFYDKKTLFVHTSPDCEVRIASQPRGTPFRQIGVISLSNGLILGHDECAHGVLSELRESPFVRCLARSNRRHHLVTFSEAIRCVFDSSETTPAIRNRLAKVKQNVNPKLKGLGIALESVHNVGYEIRWLT